MGLVIALVVIWVLVRCLRSRYAIVDAIAEVVRTPIVVLAILIVPVRWVDGVRRVFRRGG